ncbi:MAG TPA: IS3 family transposase, partial [Actinomycetes bacterium]|nr:IS3 family transposase [Actinomycetes bacterium]
MTRYRFIHANRAEYGVRRCCRTVGVSPSSFYDWHRRGPSVRAQADQRLLGQIRRIHRDSGGAYGAPRVHAELQLACGVRVGRKRVARLMRAAGLVGVHRRRRFRPGLTRRDPRAAPAPDLCHRQFSPPAPDRLWHADYTELPTDQGPLYLVAVVDGCSRLAVGYAMGEHATAELAIGAVELGVGRRGLVGDGLIHHSDQGAQFTSLAFGNRLRGLGIRASMGSVGDCYDHALIESFYATLECELIDRRHWATRE